MDYPPYAPHTRLSAPARQTAELWRTVAGLLLGAVLFLALARTLSGLVMSLLPDPVPPGSASYALLQLLTVGLIGASVALVVRLLHNRSVATLLGPLAAARADFLRVIAPMAGLTAILSLLQILTLEATPIPAQPLDRWLILLPFGLAATSIQVSAEELVFRGYLQQQLAARLRWPVLWIALPSALFAAVHYGPAQYGGNALFIALWAGLFGVAMADLTARTGTLGAAIGVHFAFNVWAILGVALPGPLVGLALFVLPFGASDEARLAALLPGEVLSIALAWLVARIALRV